AAELSGRYEEIDLIYTISEILGHTIRLDEAANRILREVSAVVRARRATLMVHDPRANVLRLVAARGVELGEVDPIEVDDPKSIARSRTRGSSSATWGNRACAASWSSPTISSSNCCRRRRWWPRRGTWRLAAVRPNRWAAIFIICSAYMGKGLG